MRVMRKPTGHHIGGCERQRVEACVADIFHSLALAPTNESSFAAVRTRSNSRASSDESGFLPARCSSAPTRLPLTATILNG